MNAPDPAATPPLLAPDSSVAGEEDPGAALDAPDWSALMVARDPQPLPTFACTPLAKINPNKSAMPALPPVPDTTIA